ncbi:MAG TPA: GNAT family N-acetyltransferase [Oryzihumus sp.]|nr:GNAT family N-acetyltransferase [Oryzihumus sp.]
MGEAAIRRATAADVPAIVGLLADDVLGAQRERPGDPAYAKAFEAIAADPHQWLMVADADGEVVGTLQLTLIPGLSHRGTTRAQVEAVRVSASRRGSGLGTRMLEWAVGTARDLGCGVVQLTSNASRADAHRFYERLGFEASHTGFKLALRPPR